MLNQRSMRSTTPAASVRRCAWCHDIQVIMVVPAGYRCLVCDHSQAIPPPVVVPPVLPTTDVADAGTAYHYQCDQHALAVVLCAARGEQEDNHA